MPLISTMPLLGDTVSVEDFYTGGLFDPKAAPDNLEILNGGLDSDNYGAGLESIEPYMCQYGSFAIGFFTGFERDHKTYANQVSTGTAQHSVHSQLSSQIYLPWSPSVLIYGYQAFLQQDATIWDHAGSPQSEYWYVELAKRAVGGASDVIDESRMYLAPSRGTTNAATVGSPGEASQYRWRYVNKHKIETGVAKGYHEFEVRIKSGVKSPDKARAKLKTVIGGFYVLAIR
mgnify:CR=1 FL=1